MYPVIPAIAIASALNWLPCSPAELDAFTKHGDVWWKICWGPNRPDSTLAVGTVNKQVGKNKGVGSRIERMTSPNERMQLTGPASRFSGVQRQSSRPGN